MSLADELRCLAEADEETRKSVAKSLEMPEYVGVCGQSAIILRRAIAVVELVEHMPDMKGINIQLPGRIGFLPVDTLVAEWMQTLRDAVK